MKPICEAVPQLRASAEPPDSMHMMQNANCVRSSSVLAEISRRVMKSGSGMGPQLVQPASLVVQRQCRLFTRGAWRIRGQGMTLPGPKETSNVQTPARRTTFATVVSQVGSAIVAAVALLAACSFVAPAVRCRVLFYTAARHIEYSTDVLLGRVVLLLDDVCPSANQPLALHRMHDCVAVGC